MTPALLRKVFNIDAVIGNDPRTKKPICITYDLIKGEERDEEMADDFARTLVGSM